MSTVNDQTKFSFFVVTAMLGLSVWLTEMYVEGKATASALEETNAKVERLEQLQTDVAVIKSEVHEIKQHVEEDR